MRLILLTVAALAIFTTSQNFQPTAFAEPEKTELAKQTQTDDFQRISLDDAKKDFDAGTAIIIDARDEGSYKNEHIKGALNIPYGDFDKKYKSIPKDKKIIVYCSCPSEHTSGLEVQKFNEKKVKNVYALTGGTKAWKEAGYPMEQSN